MIAQPGSGASGKEITLSLPEDHGAAIAVLRGAITANGSREASDAEEHAA
jgi:redox-sensitive bicupin YhaK (pirin superfamily)